MELTTLDKVVAMFYSRKDILPEHSNDAEIMTLASDTAEYFQVDKMCDPTVTMMRVENYTTPLPSKFKKIIESAYKGDNVRDAHDRPMYRDEVVSWSGKVFKDCDVKFSVECPKCHQNECPCGDDSVLIRVDDDWLQANADRNYWQDPRFVGSYGLNKPGNIYSRYHPEFSLMRPARHRFHAADYHVKGCINLDARLQGRSPVEYQKLNKHLRLNAETGTVLLAYLAKQTDEFGWPLVPNDTDIFEAFFWNIEYKYLYKYQNRHKDNYQKALRAKEYAEFHLKRAVEKLTTIPPAQWAGMIMNYFKTIPYRNADQMAHRTIGDRFDAFVRRDNH